MRIALFYNTPSGGAKRAIYEWTRRLAQVHEIDVFTLSSADHAFCDIRPFVQAYRVFDFTAHRLFESPWGRLNQLQRWRSLGALIEVNRCIAGEIDAGEYDIVLANTCMYTFVPAFLRFVEVPAVYYLHEPFGRLCARQLRRPYLQNNSWRAVVDRADPLIRLYDSRLRGIQRKSVRRTERFLANSLFTQEQMKAEFSVDAPVCHHGVDCEAFHPMPGVRKEAFVVSVGELSARKGFDFLVESLDCLPENRRPGLVLACNMVHSAEKEYVQSLAARHMVELEVLIKLDTEQLMRLYNRAQLCVYAPVLEPFGLVPLEAMACGTPVVGVQEGGVRESVVHGLTGLLTERDPVSFANAIRSLLEDDQRREQFGRQAREYVQSKWTWDRSVDALEWHLVSCARS